MVLNGEGSKWVKVLSGVPQGSVLGPLLFLIFINDIDRGVASKILKFADNTKLCGAVGSLNVINTLKQDPRLLIEWLGEWQMLFNVEKCKVMHFGFNNTEKYEMYGKEIVNVREDTNLEIVIQDDLKWSKQCLKVSNSGNKLLGMIRRSIVYKTKEVVVQLYKSLVRPHLEYCVHAWSPHTRRKTSNCSRRFRGGFENN